MAVHLEVITDSQGFPPTNRFLILNLNHIGDSFVAVMRIHQKHHKIQRDTKIQEDELIPSLLTERYDTLLREVHVVTNQRSTTENVAYGITKKLCHYSVTLSLQSLLIENCFRIITCL